MEVPKEIEKSLPEKENRIYDTLAQVFAGYSECTAIAKIGNATYIAANEVASDSKKASKKQQLIQQSEDLILTFLTTPSQDLDGRIRDFAKLRDINQGKEKQITVPFCAGIVKPTTKQLVFAELVCHLDRQRTALKQTASLYTSDIHTQAITHATNGNKDLKLSDIQRMFGHNEGIGFYACGSAMAQWEHFGKAIDYYFEQAKDNKSPLLPVWAYDEKDNVHAEMKILNQLLEDIESGKISSGASIYIGISKDCCFHCHHTLKAAEQVLKENKISVVISTRGAHDVSFGDSKGTPVPKWQFPCILRKKDLSSYKVLTGKIIDSIREKSRELFKSEPSLIDVSMGASEASSSDEEQNFADVHKQCLLSWGDTIYRRMQISSDETIRQEKEVVELGLMLHKDENFARLFDVEVPLDKERAEELFNGLLYNLLEGNFANAKTQPKMLFDFLKNRCFAGDIMAHCFTNLDDNVLKASKDKEKKDNLENLTRNQNVEIDKTFGSTKIIIKKAILSQFNFEKSLATLDKDKLNQEKDKSLNRKRERDCDENQSNKDPETIKKKI